MSTPSRVITVDIDVFFGDNFILKDPLICDVTSKWVKKWENTCTLQLFSTKNLVFNNGKSYINRKLIKLRKQIHTMQILFLKLWKLTEKREMNNFHIFYWCAISTRFFIRKDHFYLISLEYDNVPMEVSFHLQKSRLKTIEANKSNDLSCFHELSHFPVSDVNRISSTPLPWVKLCP